MLILFIFDVRVLRIILKSLDFSNANKIKILLINGKFDLCPTILYTRFT